jgi:hypothetical protein
VGRLLTIASALVCIGAGLYLLQYNATGSGDAAGGTSWFQIIGHGMGIYFIGKGLFVGRSLFMAESQNSKLDLIAYYLSGETDEPDQTTAEPVPAD